MRKISKKYQELFKIPAIFVGHAHEKPLTSQSSVSYKQSIQCCSFHPSLNKRDCNCFYLSDLHDFILFLLFGMIKKKLNVFLWKQIKHIIVRLAKVFFIPFSFGHCIVCNIYNLCLPICNLFGQIQYRAVPYTVKLYYYMYTSC